MLTRTFSCYVKTFHYNIDTVELRMLFNMMLVDPHFPSHAYLFCEIKNAHLALGLQHTVQKSVKV